MSHQRRLLAAAVVALALTGCGSDPSTPGEEPAPTPVSLPAGTIVEVPRIRPYISVDKALARLAAAGLVGVAPQVDFPHYFVATDPPAGTPVEAGSEIRLEIGDG